jgi:hypothetical protein
LTEAVRKGWDGWTKSWERSRNALKRRALSFAHDPRLRL